MHIMIMCMCLMVHVMKGFVMIMSNHLTQVSGQCIGYNLNEVFLIRGKRSDSDAYIEWGEETEMVTLTVDTKA